MRDIRYLLLGYGISNQSIKKYFDKNKIEYILYDDFIEEYHQNVDLNSFDVIVKSPVIKNDHWLLNLANRLHKKIITDLELFYLINPNKTFITVTGTNGKTTTVNLIWKIIENIDLGGNVGIPLFDFIESNNNIVIEASSFMLEYTEKFHSKINVILNISPNHLDHHLNFKNYLNSKFNLFRNIKRNDYIIYNYDDKLLRRLISNFNASLIPFSVEKEVDGAYLKDNWIYFKGKKILNTENLNLIGKHNLANIAASVGAALCYNPKLENIEDRVRAFKPVEHRIEFVGTYKGVKIYNDSKSTNYKALKIALDSFVNEKVLLICGGKPRIDDIELLNDSLKYLTYVLTNGEDRNSYNNYFKEKNIPYVSFERIDELLNELDKYIKDCTIVLFSPGSPSYDQFKNFEERGKYFKLRINQLIEKNQN